MLVLGAGVGAGSGPLGACDGGALGAGVCAGASGAAGDADGGVDCAGLPDGEGVVGVAASPAHDTARRQMAIE